MLTTVDLSKATSGAEGGGRVFALDGGAWLLVTPGPDGGASFDGGDGGIPAQTATLGQSLSTSPYSHRRFRFSAEVNVAVADTDTSLLTVVTADDAGAGILATLTTRAESLDVRYSTLSTTGGSTKMVLPHDAWVPVTPPRERSQPDLAR